MFETFDAFHPQTHLICHTIADRLAEHYTVPLVSLDSAPTLSRARLSIFAPETLQAYKDAAAQPGAVHAMCEDYRASATIVLEHDKADRDAGRKLACPLRVLWGQYGLIEHCYDALALWREVAENVSGRSIPSGHYIPEEVPDLLYDEIREFLR